MWKGLQTIFLPPTGFGNLISKSQFSALNCWRMTGWTETPERVSAKAKGEEAHEVHTLSHPAPLRIFAVMPHHEAASTVRALRLYDMGETNKQDLKANKLLAQNTSPFKTLSKGIVLWFIINATVFCEWTIINTINKIGWLSNHNVVDLVRGPPSSFLNIVFTLK